MGLFDAMLRGFGIEDDLKQTSPIKPRKAAQTKSAQNKYDTFNLHQKSAAEKQIKEDLNRLNLTNKQSNLVLFAPSTHEEVQQVVDFLKKDQACIINLQQISTEDNMRVLDFFSGALYALNGQITRIQDDLFLATPESVNIKFK